MSNKTKEKNLLLRTTILGVMSGMRSMSPIAELSRRAAEHKSAFKSTPFAFLSSPTATTLTTLSQVGEIVVDKLPFLPARIVPQQLFGRAFFGGVAGAVAFSEEKKPGVLGVLIGASSAIVSSYVFYFVRRQVGKATHLPDLIVALVEDAGVVALGKAVTRTYK